MRYYKNKVLKLFIKISLVLFLVCPCIVLGQTYFNMRYPPDSGTWGGWTISIIVEDSSFIFNQSSRNFTDGFRNFSLSKINSFGDNLIALDSIHFDTLDMTTAGLKESSTGYIDVSSMANLNSQSQQYGIIKYDSTGKVSHHKIDATEYIYIYITDFQELVNQNVILVGTVQLDSGSINNRKTILIKIDSLGNELWQKTYKFSNYMHSGESIALCKDGGFIIGGDERNYNVTPSFRNPLIIKVDSVGNMQWRRTYGSTDFSNRGANGIIQTQDGGYAFVGAVGVNDSFNIDQHIPWVVKLDSNGVIEWSKKSEGDKTNSAPYNNFFTDIIELNNGSLITCGYQKITYPNKPTTDKHRIRGTIAKYAQDGTPIWRRYYHHPEVKDEPLSINILHDIKPTPDGGFVAAGYLAHSIDNTQDTWVIKVDSFGCLVQGCEVISVPRINAPIASLKIYPNPATESIKIEITPSGNQQEFVLELYDILGRLVLTKTLYPHQNTVSISHLKTGVYSYRIGEVWGQVVVE